MLKRYQVLLTDWLGDYVKFLSEKYDLSFSEIIRLIVCSFTCCITTKLYPKFKCDINEKTILDEFKKINKKDGVEDAHKLISKIYFEARKATEFRMQKEKKGK